MTVPTSVAVSVAMSVPMSVATNVAKYNECRSKCHIQSPIQRRKSPNAITIVGIRLFLIKLKELHPYTCEVIHCNYTIF